MAVASTVWYAFPASPVPQLCSALALLFALFALHQRIVQLRFDRLSLSALRPPSLHFCSARALLRSLLFLLFINVSSNCGLAGCPGLPCAFPPSTFALRCLSVIALLLVHLQADRLPVSALRLPSPPPCQSWLCPYFVWVKSPTGGSSLPCGSLLPLLLLVVLLLFAGLESYRRVESAVRVSQRVAVTDATRHLTA